MVAVFLLGKLSALSQDLLQFLKYEVSKDENWRVQEILAMAFDNYCKDIGYEKALVDIKDWLTFKHQNTRRAVSEGLRIWTNKPYFKNNPKVAIQILSSLKNDNSGYVRKSCGNALRDISKKYPELVVADLSSWDDSDKETQVKKLVMKNKKLTDLI